MSLDDLVAMNDEIAGLVRAGVPLELGLASWGRDLSGPLRKTAATLTESVSQGRGLSDALADEKLEIPAVYRAVVNAGLRSGRLPAALEAVAESAANLQQLRAAIALSMIYPLLLVCIAYALFLVLLLIVLPAEMAVYEDHPPATLALAHRVAMTAYAGIPIPGTERVIPWVVFPPFLLLGLAAAWWSRTRRAIVLDVGAAGRWLAWLPMAGRAVRQARTASLAELFGLLIAHDVPLAESLRLAATSTGDRRMAASAVELAALVEQGHLPQSARLEAAGMPPVLALLVATGARQPTLVAISRQAAETYRVRVARDIQWLRDWLPVWLILTVGSTVALVYCLTFFVPFSQLLETLSGSVGSSIRIGK
jgi:type II secretory pathway component PulF